MQVSFLFRRARAAFSSGRQLRARPRGDVTSEEPLTGEAQPRRVGRHRDPGVGFSMAFPSTIHCPMLSYVETRTSEMSNPCHPLGLHNFVLRSG